jgi:hypothetical protein
MQHCADVNGGAILGHTGTHFPLNSLQWIYMLCQNGSACGFIARIVPRDVV